MTQYDTGKFADYTPPPPPRSGKSPWLWVAVGCGGLMLLGFGGCVALVATVKSKIKTEMSKPYDPVAAQAAMGDTPVYPNATQDEMTSKLMRAMVEPMLKMKYSSATIHGVGYTTPDDFNKVSTWYEDQLQKAGYTQKKEVQNADSFQKGEDIITVQTSKNKTTGKTTFMVMRVHGAKD